MKIRSITVFVHPGWPLDVNQLKQAGKFMTSARQAFERGGYTVQTTRLATVPFPELVGSEDSGEVVKLAQEIEKLAGAEGFEFVSIGPALPGNLSHFQAIPEALSATQSVFLAGMMTQPGGIVSLPAVRRCAQIIHQAASISPDGFGNLRFAALANVPAGSPFFPAAYHDHHTPGFALALEAAALAVEAFSTAVDLQAGCQRLEEQVEQHGETLRQIGQALQAQYGYRFRGLDFSLAPYPERPTSIGVALERIGTPAIGLPGSLAAAALVASTLDQAQFPSTGFNGLFLPVLEDTILAKRASEGILTVNDLLLYSAVCGTGLDTVPLPGDTPAEALEAVLLDLAVLAQRLDKPLTARLMPIPGKKAGEPTDFDFSYFANSRVMELDAKPLQGLLAEGERFFIKPRK